MMSSLSPFIAFVLAAPALSVTRKLTPFSPIYSVARSIHAAYFFIPLDRMFQHVAAVSSDEFITSMTRLPEKKSFYGVLLFHALKRVTVEVASHPASLCNRVHYQRVLLKA
jgi:hypothetical protein